METPGNTASQSVSLLLKPASWLSDAITAFLLPSDHQRVLIKKLGYGLLGAVYAYTVMTALLVTAVALGVGTVMMWMEEPMVLREDLHFDYTQFHPEAFFSFPAVPVVGHTYYVSVILMLPESDYNRQIGVFQLTAEVLSKNGTLISRASHPCMLQFRSKPIRLARTVLKGVPLLLGTSLEAQKLTMDLLEYRESGKGDTLRSDTIRVRLAPRAGTSFLPELYESQILVRSKLPWHKELVWRWKWTFYVWASLYSYVMMLPLVHCCFRPLVFPRSRAGGRRGVGERREADEVHAGTLRTSQQYRKRRKEELLGRSSPDESVGLESSVMTSDTVPPLEDEIGDGWAGWGDGDGEDEVADSSSVCQ